MAKVTKSYKIAAPKSLVFKVLTDEEFVAEWTGDDAVMSNEVGFEFDLWSGAIVGINLEVSEDKIVQDWKEDTWKDYSKVTFLLSENKGITTLELIHEGIPEEKKEAIADGWDDYYLQAVKELAEDLADSN